MSYYTMRTDPRLVRRELSRRLEHFEDFDRRVRGDTGCGCGCGCNGTKRNETARVEVETRAVCVGAVCVEQRDGRTWLHGLAHRFGTWSGTLCDLSEVEGDCYREVVEIGAFNPALGRADIDVRVCVDHDEARTFARYRNRSDDTADVWADSTGLHFSCYIPGTSIGLTVKDGIRTGRLTGCSFRMRDVKSQWLRAESGEIVRRIISVGELLDCCLTSRPAYTFAGPDPAPVAA